MECKGQEQNGEWYSTGLPSARRADWTCGEFHLLMIRIEGATDDGRSRQFRNGAREVGDDNCP